MTRKSKRSANRNNRSKTCKVRQRMPKMQQPQKTKLIRWTAMLSLLSLTACISPQAISSACTWETMSYQDSGYAQRWTTNEIRWAVKHDEMVDKLCRKH